MAESRIKAENYITIQGWMVTELGLRNNRLLLYALIYGFSQDGKSGYSGKQDYLLEWLDCSRSVLYNYIKELKTKGLLREVTTPTGQKLLQAVRVLKCAKSEHNVQKMDMGCPENGHGNVQKMDMGCPENGLLPIYNTIDNPLYIDSSSVNIDTPVEPPTPPTVEEIADYCRERGNKIDPQRFHDFYSLRKWQGREGSIAEPEQWQAIIRLWETNGRDDKKPGKPAEQYNGGSFDTDEFFEAALRRSYADIADWDINGG